MRKAAIMAAFLVTSAGTLLFAGCAMDAFLSDKKACDFHTVAGLGDGLPYSIREYPSFSFTVGDLHPHVMALPFFVLALMFIYILIRDDRPRAGAAALVGFALATSGMINSWDFITLASVIGVATSMKARQSFYAFPSAKKIAGMWAMVFFVVLLAAGLFMWPYLRDLQSPVPGIGFSPSYVSLHKLKDIQYPTPLSAQVGIWGLFAAGMVLSIIWMRRKICNEELTVSLTIVALGIITGMELVFVRDMYSITFPTFFRANTTYKFGYHAWVMLCIVFSVWMAALCERMQGKRIWVPRLLMILAIAGGMFYPVQAIRQYYLVDPFGPTLNGMAWLWHSDAGDFATVNYINHMFPERAVIAEAVGDFGMYSCVTSYTGMITPMGWSGHEWAWRFHEDKRNPQETGWYKIAYVRGDIQRLYETADVEEAARIIKDYHIDYVYIGDVEQQTYRRLHEEKFSRLGKVVLTSFNARLYKVNPDYKTN